MWTRLWMIAGVLAAGGLLMAGLYLMNRWLRHDPLLKEYDATVPPETRVRW